MEVRLRPRRRAGSSSLTEHEVVLPNACPQCSGPGYLEHINLVRETKTQTCRECQILWESPIADD